MRALPAFLALIAAFATSSPARALDLSGVESLLDLVGVEVSLPDIDVDLPAAAEQAIDDSLSRAEDAIRGVFGDDGVVNDVDVDQIVSDALARADQAVEDALARADQAVEDAQNRAEGALEDLEITIPEVEIPDVDAIVDNALREADAAVEAALDRADQILEDLGLSDVVDEALEMTQGVLDDVLGDSGVTALPVLAAVDASAVVSDSAGASIAYASFAVQPTATSIPEPGALVLVAGGLLALLAGRR